VRTIAVASIAGLLLLAATPRPAPEPSAQSLSIVCQIAPFWLFGRSENRPVRAGVPPASLGARFGLVSGPRTTLESDQYYETDVVAIEPGYAGQHYWIARSCALVTP
jgi:hypothetical protein